MNHVRKGTEPQSLSLARRGIKSTKYDGRKWYDALSGAVKDDIKAQCLKEQYFLCPYTGIRIEMESSHLEHMFPRSSCSDAESIDYGNLLACYPIGHAEFGARKKDSWPTEDKRDKLVRPTETDCESRFAYSLVGGIDARDAADVAAKETIRELKLNHPALVSWRRDALAELTMLSDIASLKSRLAQLEEVPTGKQEEYPVAKRQYLRKKLYRLKMMVKSIREQRQK